MFLYNPVQPGSISTPELADGAVTLSKTDFETLPLPVTAGGTGEASPTITAGLGIAISGAWPSQTVTNTEPNTYPGSPLPVADGGTGTASPALSAGANITLSGAWPNETIAVTNPLAPGDIDCDGADTITVAPPVSSGLTGWKLRLFNGSYAIGVADYTLVNLTNLWFSLFENTTYPAKNATTITPDTNATVSLGGGGQVIAQKLTLKGSVAGVGGQTATGLGVSLVIGDTSGTGKTASIAETPILTTTATGWYRASIFAAIYSATSNSALTVDVYFTYIGLAYTAAVITVTSSPTGDSVDSGTFMFLADTGTNVSFSTSWTSGGGSDSYDYAVLIERVK